MSCAPPSKLTVIRLGGTVGTRYPSRVVGWPGCSCGFSPSARAASSSAKAGTGLPLDMTVRGTLRTTSSASTDTACAQVVVSSNREPLRRRRQEHMVAQLDPAKHQLARMAAVIERAEKIAVEPGKQRAQRALPIGQRGQLDRCRKDDVQPDHARATVDGGRDGATNLAGHEAGRQVLERRRAIGFLVEGNDDRR